MSGRFPAFFTCFQSAGMGIAGAGGRDPSPVPGGAWLDLPSCAAYAGLALAIDRHCDDRAFFYKIIPRLAALNKMYILKQQGHTTPVTKNQQEE